MCPNRPEAVSMFRAMKVPGMVVATRSPLAALRFVSRCFSLRASAATFGANSVFRGAADDIGVEVGTHGGGGGGDGTSVDGVLVGQFRGNQPFVAHLVRLTVEIVEQHQHLVDEAFAGGERQRARGPDKGGKVGCRPEVRPDRAVSTIQEPGDRRRPGCRGPSPRPLRCAPLCHCSLRTRGGAPPTHTVFPGND